MMYVKTHVGDGQWRLYEAQDRISFLGDHNRIEVFYRERSDLPEGMPVGKRTEYRDEEPPPFEENWLLRFPYADVRHFALCPNETGKPWYLSWVQWWTHDVTHLLVMDAPTFLMNEGGDTIQKLR